MQWARRPGSRRSPDGAAPGRVGFFLARAGRCTLEGGSPHGPTPGFPHDFGILPRMSIFSERAPMCRADRSAHGRISTALNAGAFPHDSADSPPAGSGRMCSTASTGPMPHIRARQQRPDTANTTPVRPTAAREDGFCAPRGPALAFWEDHSVPPPEGAAHEPWNYAETVGSIRRVGANDPPKVPFPRPPPAARPGHRHPPGRGRQHPVHPDRRHPAASTWSAPAAVVVQPP